MSICSNSLAVYPHPLVVISKEGRCVLPNHQNCLEMKCYDKISVKIVSKVSEVGHNVNFATTANYLHYEFML